MEVNIDDNIKRWAEHVKMCVIVCLVLCKEEEVGLSTTGAKADTPHTVQLETANANQPTDFCGGQ
jgi:hypothetical protein